MIDYVTMMNDKLISACEIGDLPKVKSLIKKGANIHAENDAALCWSAENGHLEVVKFLVQNGANIHADSDYALRWATHNGHINIVNYLKLVKNLRSLQL